MQLLNKSLLVFFLLLTINAAGQKGKSPVLGIIGGLNFMDQGPDYTNELNDRYAYSARPGISFGGMAHFQASEHFALESVLLYSINRCHEEIRNGASTMYDYNYTSGRSTFDLFLHFLKEVRQGDHVFSAGGGPFIFYTPSRWYAENKRLEYGLSLQTSIRLPIGFSLELNYARGLSRTNTGPAGFKQTSRRLGLLLGYYF